MKAKLMKYKTKTVPHPMSQRYQRTLKSELCIIMSSRRNKAIEEIFSVKYKAFMMRTVSAYSNKLINPGSWLGNIAIISIKSLL